MADLVLVRAEGAVSPSASSKALLVVNNQVVPALRGVIGAGLVLPAVIVIRERVEGHGASPDGQVPATVDEHGVITSVGQPVVAASDDEAHLAFIIGHELAHYHELSLRKGAALAIPSLRACWLWSEYYAQRVVCAAGLMDERLHTDLLEAGPSPRSTNDDGDDGASWSYMMAFVKGQYDVDPACLDRYPDAQRQYLAPLLSRLKTAALEDAVQRFPDWSPPEVVLVEGMIKALAVTDPARQRRRRQRRRARRR